MFENIVEQLEVLKRRLTWQAWTQGASTLHDNVQYESLFQGFRIVGTITKDGGRCRAFKVGNKVGIEYLNQFVPDDYKVKQFTYQSKLRLDKAKELYPEWYQKRVVEKKPRNTWTCNPALYQWWIRMLKDGAQQGHRYWCIMVLAIYAKKCGIDKDVLEEDSYGLIPFMNSIGNGKDEFTEDDVLHALEAYRDSYMKYSIDKIVYRTGIQIKKNKRNGRKQNLHLKGARAIQEINDPTGEWRKGAGRKPKGDMVAYWRDRHPNGTKIQCERDTGLSRHTVLKWWN
jgi:hypothetical protein